MLGKGLESLIPQKGNQGAPGSEPASQQPAAMTPVPAVQPTPVTQPAQPVAQPASQPQSQPQPQRATQPAATSYQPTAGESIYHIEVEKITPNPEQPRRHFDQAGLHELANSIREFGLLQPIIVSKIEKETPSGINVEYQIIAGERRFMASKLLGLARIPAIIRNINLEREKLELGVIENIQRENLNPIETARAFQRLQEEFRMTQREIAAKLGKSREVVANSMRLLDLPEYIQRALETGEVSESHARLLIGVEDPAVQKQLLDDIVTNKLTTRDVRERIQHVAASTNGDGPRRGRPPLEEVHLTPEVQTLKDELSTTLGAPVEISKSTNNGKISITFFSEEELENILRRLRNEQ